mmetsp:Transcript_1740/g.4383  ORF Transcript_1740/g.4383 Transcript_1740/m.4383 type:complete len:216 (-) Transcript_1740:479-1126(-)
MLGKPVCDVRSLHQDLLQAHTKCLDQLHSRSGKVGRGACLVGLHDRQPLAPRAVVAGNGGLALVEHSHGMLRGHHDGQARRCTQSLLTGSHSHIHAPGIKQKGLSADGAHAIYHHKRVWVLGLHHFADGLHRHEHPGACINMRNGDHLVRLLIKSGLDCCQRGALAHRGPHVRSARTIHFKRLCKPVAKEACVEHQNIFPGLNQVDSHHVPSQCS